MGVGGRGCWGKRSQQLGLLEADHLYLDYVGRGSFYGFLEVWPESHWPGFALRQSDVFQSYAAQ